MHPVANEVPISTERIFKIMRKYARPGFTGKVSIPLRVKPEAALEVEFGPEEVLLSQGVSERASLASPPLMDDNGSNERELKVQRKLIENQNLFQIRTRIRSVIGHFKDGNMNTFQLEMVG